MKQDTKSAALHLAALWVKKVGRASRKFSDRHYKILT